MENLNPLAWFTIPEIVLASILALVCAIVVALVLSQRLRNFIGTLPISYWCRRRRVLKEIKAYIYRHRDHRAAGLIAGHLIRNCIIQLFGAGENVSLAEYATLLRESLEASSKRFVAVSKFLPSDWYAHTPALHAITDYLEAQKNKRAQSPSTIMMRIVLADPTTFEADSQFERFKAFHETNHIGLRVYDIKHCLPEPTDYRDFALFEDQIGCWIVESHDLNRELASKHPFKEYKEYLEKVSIVDDKRQIAHDYEGLIKRLTTPDACTVIVNQNSRIA